MPKSVSAALLVRALLLLAGGGPQAAFADPLHEIAAHAYQHENSGWIFPEHVAGFTRIGAAQMVDGSDDAIAYYQCGSADARTTVLVQLHAKDSAAASQTAAGEPFTVRAGARTLDGTKAANAAEHAVRYWFDTGAWAVEVTSAPAPGVAATIDTLVRELRWATLPLTD